MASRRSFLKFLGIVPVAVATAGQANPAAMDIDEAVAKLEEGRVVKDGLPAHCCQTGNQYVVISHSGIKEQGKEFLGYYSTRSEAIEGWLDHALMYAKDRPGTLYWRSKPELDCRIKNGKEDWMVYSRFVITDNPEVFQSREELINPKPIHGRKVFSASHNKEIIEYGV